MPNTTAPHLLHFYRTDTDNRYVFWWDFTLDVTVPLPVLATDNYQLEIDTVSTFSSGNLRSFTRADGDLVGSLGATAIQEGLLVKAYEIDFSVLYPLAIRQDSGAQTFYARVRRFNGFYTSAFSPVLEWTTSPRFTELSFANLFNRLPDEHIYSREDLRKAEIDRTSVLSAFLGEMAAEFDQSQLELFLTAQDNYLASVRDGAIFNNFGRFFNFQKPTTMVPAEYHHLLGCLIAAALVGSTTAAIKTVLKCFTGANPVLQVLDNFTGAFINIDLLTLYLFTFGPTAGRPIAPLIGQMYGNTQTHAWEMWDGTQWVGQMVLGL